MADPTVDTVLPSTTSSGPIAAARAATFRMVFFCASLMLLSLSTNACTLETTARIAGMSSSPKLIASSSSWDFRMVSWPFRLSCMVAAMLSAVPSQFSIAEDSLSISSGAAFIKARKPDMAFLPTRDSAAAAASDSERPENATRQSARISDRSLMEPSALEVWIVTSPIFFPAIFTSPARLFMMVRRDVPAWLPLIPAFAIRPIASAVSSAEKPSAPAIGAAYLKVSPIMETLVFALELAAARISAKWPESEAESPNAVRASVTISEVVARSSPDAAARFMMPSIPSIMSPVFQPAMAMYSKADAASVAENLVLAPISRAFPRRSSRSFPVAPEMAATLDMPSSKSAAVFTAAVPSPTMGAVTWVVRVFPTEEIFSPTCWNLPPTSSILARVALVVDAWDSKDFSCCSVSWISRWSASYCCWVISPFCSCSFACSAAVFSVASFSFVSLMA